MCSRIWWACCAHHVGKYVVGKGDLGQERLQIYFVDRAVYMFVLSVSKRGLLYNYLNWKKEKKGR